MQHLIIVVGVQLFAAVALSLIVLLVGAFRALVGVELVGVVVLRVHLSHG